MTIGVNFASPVGQLRALIPDIELLPDPTDPSKMEYVFSDEHLSALIALNNGNIRLAYSDVLYALGTVEALVSKVIKTEDLQTDGAKLMTQFRMQAAEVRRQAKAEDENIGGLILVEGHTPHRHPELSPFLFPWGVCS